eukprot:jgi/Chlat1/4940/Chrsp31S04787
MLGSAAGSCQVVPSSKTVVRGAAVGGSGRALQRSKQSNSSRRGAAPLLVWAQAGKDAALEALREDSASNGSNGSAGLNGNGNGQVNGVYTNGVVNLKEALANNAAVLEASTNGAELNGVKRKANGNGTAVLEAEQLNGNGVDASAVAAVIMKEFDEPNGVRLEESLGASVSGSSQQTVVPPFSSATSSPVLEAPLQTPTQSQLKAAAVVAEAAGGKWNRFKTYGTLQRSFEIWKFVASFFIKNFLIKQKWTYKGGMTPAKQSERRSILARWVKDELLRLGPTFIKLGQQFSTRVDVLSPEFVKELESLQDRVPPFDHTVARQIIEEELGRPVEAVFDSFEDVPIAAASLGQVHRAVLNGKQVVIKVQRPGLKDLFDIDLKNLRVLAVNLQKIDPKTDGAKRDWVAIYDECAQMLYREIDYVQEGENSEEFRRNFANEPWVKVPEIYWPYTTKRVLTMEYAPGLKINDAAGIDRLGLDRQRLARLSVESYLMQILRHGFFHADPHPGNIAVDAETGGRLIYYDFGMMGRINKDIRSGLQDAFYAVYERDASKVLDAMVKMGVLVPTGDMVSIRRTAQFFLDSFGERLKKQKEEKQQGEVAGFKPKLSKEEKQAKRSQRLASIGEDLLAVAADQPFRFPATFTFVVRSFTVLDGIGKSLDPRFDITEIAKPFVQEILNLKEVGVNLVVKDLSTRLQRNNSAIGNLFKGPDRIAKLENVLERLEQGDLKLRVRTLESERAFKRVAEMQSLIFKGVLAATFANIGTTLQANAVRQPALASFAMCGFFMLQSLVSVLKVKRLDKLEKQIMGIV